MSPEQARALLRMEGARVRQLLIDIGTEEATWRAHAARPGAVDDLPGPAGRVHEVVTDFLRDRLAALARAEDRLSTQPAGSTGAEFQLAGRA